MKHVRPAWRWLVVPAMLVYALLAWSSGIDRSAVELDGQERWVPEALRSTIPVSQARELVGAGIPGSALEPARIAVLRDPVNPASSALLGTALLARGDSKAADRAFRVAARLGWREPLTQLYWFQAALGQNDLASAVLRFDAIARQHPDAPYVSAMATMLERTDAGRDAIAARLATGANWANGYAIIRSGTSIARIRNRIDVLSRVAARGGVLGCAVLLQPVRVFAEVEPLAGRELWRAHCPRAAGSALVSDGGFEKSVLASPDEQVPYDWIVTGHGGLDVAPTSDQSGGQAISVRSTASVTLPFLEQLVPAAPGRYRLSWRVKESDPTRSARMLASFSCSRDLLAAQPAPGMASGDRFSRTVELAANCQAAWLRLWLAPGAEGITIDDVRLDPI